MATVTGYTAARMLEIENACIIAGAVDLSGHLILERQDGSTIDAGDVTGPPGPAGTINGSMGATDNVIPRTDGTGGVTVQGSIATIEDDGTVRSPQARLDTAAPTQIYHATRKDYVDTGRVETGCIVRRTSAQSLTNNTPYTIAYDASDIRDPDGFHDPVTNNTRMTVPTGKGGLYRLTVYVNFAGSATGQREVYYAINAASVNLHYGPSPSGGLAVSTMAEFELTAGQYVEVLVIQGSGGALNLNSSRASLIRVSA